MSAATSQSTIERLRSVFATHGLPEVLVSDNGTPFTSAEFATFTRANGIKHLTSAPYHPASNGLAERGVQTLKTAIKKADGGGSLESQICRFLFQYRLTPHSTTGVSPAELLLNRRPRSRLDLLYPDVSSRVRKNQVKQKANHDNHSRKRTFNVGDLVSVKSQHSRAPWLPGVVSTMLSPQRCIVHLDDGRDMECHIDHIRHRMQPESDRATRDPGPPQLIELEDGLEQQAPTVGCPDTNRTATQQQDHPTILLRRSTRDHRPPDRLM